MAFLRDVREQFSGNRELSDWVRSFAEDTLPVCTNPSTEEVRRALAAHLSEKLAEVPPDATAEEILEKILGIAVIVQYGRERIGWSVTTDSTEADTLHLLYSNALSSELRRALGINGHWIFLANSDLLDVYGLDELIAAEPFPIEMYEQYPALLRLEDRQECVIVKL